MDRRDDDFVIERRGDDFFVMDKRDEGFARVYWRTRLQLTGCMAFIVLVLVLVGLVMKWLGHR